MELTEFYELIPDIFITYVLSFKAFLILSGLCLWAVVCVKKSERTIYSHFDKANSMLNKVMTVIYAKWSALAFIDVADTWASSSGLPTSASYERYFFSFLDEYVLLALPFVCLISITLSAIFRQKRLRILSFVLQFLPFVISPIIDAIRAVSNNL